MSNPSQTIKPGVFTGWHMLGIMLAFFGTIITVNMLMAYYASSSWSGILAKNTYVASQDFNLKATQAKLWAQEGFKGELRHTDETITYHLEGPAETIGGLSKITAIFHRPVGEQQDFTMMLDKDSSGDFVALHRLDPGQWIVDLAAIEDGRTIYHQAVRIVVLEPKS
jgi:nitrogen fixation protein FixH